MVILILLNKLHRLFLSILGVFRRALCCFRKRSRSPSTSDCVPLTHVVSSRETDLNWDWHDQLREPKTVQDHIELYRKKKQEALQPAQEDVEENKNFFEDMTPKITRQTKLYLGGNNNPNVEYENRLNVVSVIPVESGELQEWDEISGWEGQTLDHDAQEALRIKKKQDNERRLWELQQKRLEKGHRSLGARVGT